jgi:hypothetical protein
MYHGASTQMWRIADVFGRPPTCVYAEVIA